MKKNYFITFLLFIMSILAYGQIKNVKYDDENRLHHIQIIELSDSLNRPANINLIKTPIEFTSFAFAWDIYDNISLGDMIVNYRVHKPEKGWSEWKQSTASFAPNENKWNLYFTDLLFGLDEGLHDSISFYFIIPQNITCRGIYLVLQDLSSQIKRTNNNENVTIRDDESCPAFPTMIDRSAWCGSYNACHTPTYAPTYISPSHVIIHHGGSPDSYTDGAAVVRSYWNYHVNTLGYDDIAYNYLFDKFGNFYQGRYNPNLIPSGAYQDVKGAHSGVSNQYSIGLCYLGNTDATGNNPTTAQNNKCTHFMAWWFDFKGFSPLDSANIISQYDNDWHYLPRICGKRDVDPGNLSPGNILYNSLPTLRLNTKNIIDSCITGSSVPTNLVATPLGCPNNQVQFSWQNSGTSWYIQVSTNSSFPANSTYIKYVTGLTTYTGPSGFVLQSDNTTPLGSFQENTLYYWRICYGSGLYTSTYNFTTPSCTGPLQISASASPSYLCEGESTVLTASGASTYSWSHGLGSGSSKTVTPTSTTTYSVTGTYNSQTASATVTVYVDPIPDITLTASNQNICEGNSTTLTANGGDFYYWSHDWWLEDATTTVTPSQTTTYTVTGYNSAYCSNSASITITVSEAPVAGNASINNTVVCQNDYVTLSLAGYTQSASIQWQMSNDGINWFNIPSANVSPFNYSVNTTGNVYFRAQVSNNCGSVISNILTILSNPIPNTPTITQISNNPIILQSNAPTGNQWYKNNNPITGATNQTYIVTENGTYHTIVTINGCHSLPSNQITINNVGINDYSDDEIFIYPNPAQNIIYIQSNKPIIEANIINNLGQLVATSEQSNSIEVNNLSNGIYQLIIKTNDNIIVKPILISK